MLIQILIALAVGLVSGLAANFIFDYIKRRWLTSGVPPGAGAVAPVPAASWGLWLSLMLVPIGVVLVFVLSYQYWAVSRLERVGLIFASFIVVFVFVLLHYVTHQRRWWGGIVQALIVIGFVLGGTLIHLAMPKNIRIQCPDLVSALEEIKGETSGSIRDYYLYPIVFSHQGKGWIQPHIGPDANYDWSSQVNFGGASKTTMTMMVFASPIDLAWAQGTTISFPEVKKLHLIESAACTVEVR